MHLIIRAAIDKYLNDNGAAEVCKTHSQPLTDSIVEALERNSFHGTLLSPVPGGQPTDAYVFPHEPFGPPPPAPEKS